MNSNDNQYGFTLIEVVIALGILSIGILSLMMMHVTGIRGNANANTISHESTWAADRVENLVNVDYLDANLIDTDSDGTNMDANEDGLDDSGGNFGLDDVGTSPAGGCIATPADNCLREGIYDIFWNVAVDVPVPNVKKIKVIVMRNQGKPSRVEFEYIKADM